MLLLSQRTQKIKKSLSNSSDVSVRNFVVAGKDVSLVFLKGIIDSNLFVEGIVSKLAKYDDQNVSLQTLKEKIICIKQIEQVSTDKEICDAVLIGKVAVLLQDEQNALVVDIQKYPQRQPTEPPTSAVIQGPREGFTENIDSNICALRKRFPTKDFKIEDMTVGKYTKTKIKLAYLNSVTDKAIVKKIKERIKQINIDGIIDSYYILEYLQDRPNSMFKQIGSAEKPDVISAKILEGRVAILVDGSPIVLTVPYLFLEDLQNSNDYYTNHYYVSFLRVIRTLGILVAVIVPGVFISLRLYHYRLVPIKFLITIADSTQGLPFTPVIEILFIFVLFQLLYEVSLRLPRYLGLATSIVGALILGDTGVKAGLISPPGVIIVAMSFICMYTVPEQSSQLSILRLVFILLGASLGLLGVIGGMVYFVAYLNNLNEYTAPYLAPFSPTVKSDKKDAIFKKPLPEMTQRPKSFKKSNKVRQNNE